MSLFVVLSKAGIIYNCRSFNVMYFISATRLRVRSLLILPAFMRANTLAARQLVITEGLICGKEMIDKGLTFWTLTIWTQSADMRSFRNSEAHRYAMRKLPEWCSEATYVHWLQETAIFPDWDTVHHKMVSEGVVSKVRRPGSRHLTKDFPRPRWTKLENKFKMQRR